MEQMFLVINCGKENVILGYPWLAKTNPRIDWGKGEVTMTEETMLQHDHPDTQEQRYLIRYLGACQEPINQLEVTMTT